MKAYKSNLAKEVLSSRPDAKAVRRAIENAVSSRPNTARSSFTFKDKTGEQKRYQVRVLLSA